MKLIVTASIALTLMAVAAIAGGEGGTFEPHDNSIRPVNGYPKTGMGSNG